MKSKKKHSIFPIRILFIPILSILCLLSFGCSTAEMKISEFEFIYNNKQYMIRSAYCPGNPESCNQIIGPDFIAVDQNQDRIIDKILKGNITYFEAQEIYDYCLNFLEKQNKLNTIKSSTKSFTWNDDEFSFEMKSLHSISDLPLNEFSIIDHSTGKASVYLDRDANGVLDEILSGDIKIEEAQIQYKRIISLGIIEKEIIKKDSQFLIKE